MRTRDDERERERERGRHQLKTWLCGTSTQPGAFVLRPWVDAKLAGVFLGSPQIAQVVFSELHLH